MIGERLYDPRDALARCPRTTDALLRLRPEDRSHLLAEIEAVHDRHESLPSYKLEEVRYHLPVLRPGKIVCIAVNYAAAGTRIDPRLRGFLRCLSSLTPHQQQIRLPAEATDAYIEAELVVVVGRRAGPISPSEAMACVAGFTVGADSGVESVIRDEREAGGAPLIGKNLRAFAPVGPWITPLDDIPADHDLRIRARINGELAQDESTAAMVNGVAEIIAWVSRIGLEPGDLIMTGAPKPTWSKSRVYIAAGDIVECEIDGVGLLRNQVAEA